MAPQFYRPLTSLKILRIELVALGSSHTIRLRMLLSQCDGSTLPGQGFSRMPEPSCLHFELLHQSDQFRHLRHPKCL